MIELDCSTGEGGGQILRTALALSTITGQPFHAFAIRKNRPEPGLKAQHLAAIEALKQICGAQTNDVTIGSSELTYTPGKVKPGKYRFDIGTAGSISLFLQAVLPPLVAASTKTNLEIVGGTCGKWQAPVEYFQNVFLPFIGADVRCVIKKRGYYPHGGGIVHLDVHPTTIKPFNKTEQGVLVQIKGISHASARLSGVAERQAEAARMALSRCGVPVSIQPEYQDTLSFGSGITLWAQFTKDDEPHVLLGADALGEKGVRAEDVGRMAAEELLAAIRSGATVDKHMVDQILPFMALATPSHVRFAEMTEHARTNMWVIEKFLDVKFGVEGNVISVVKLS